MTQKPFSPKYNKQARQWDVVDCNGEITAMLGGGKKGETDAIRMSNNFNQQQGV